MKSIQLADVLKTVRVKRSICMKKRMLVVAIMLFFMPLTCFANEGDLGVIVVSRKCGEAEMNLRCPSIGHGMANCLHPSLIFKSKDGFKRLPIPKGLRGDSPVGLACVGSKNDNTSYFHVLYSVLPTGCAVCEWHHLYDTNGHLLTTSNPATITIPDMPPSQSVVPNNKSFDDLSKKLNLNEYDDTYIVCEGLHDDSKGNLRCSVEVKNGQ